uniref:Uncharacterized protein n=1 Tax=Anguilla anguilla TaxID=7936 RepID=A0A0E9PAQ2_ANGAN
MAAEAKQEPLNAVLNLLILLHDNQMYRFK